MSLIDLSRFRFLILFIIIFLIISLCYIAFLSLAKLIYPIYYESIIERYSKTYGLDPFLVTAVIRVESKFDKDAVSNKGAKGLMQISSITGKWAATELNIKDYDENMLFIPEINIRIGCWYLNKLDKQFKNNIILVLAAYNGGSGNVNKWLKDARYSRDGDTLIDIPFPETKEYINKVNKNYKIYKYLYRDKFEN